MKTDKKKEEEEKKDSEPQKEEEVQENKEEQKQEEKVQKYINPELLNDDLEESAKIEQIALQAKPYFSSNILPKSVYLQQKVLPLVYEALNQTEKKRPKDPIEFFAVFFLVGEIGIVLVYDKVSEAAPALLLRDHGVEPRLLPRERIVIDAFIHLDPFLRHRVHNNEKDAVSQEPVGAFDSLGSVRRVVAAGEEPPVVNPC